ncbi:hypothetical protein KUTeg_021883 [Tegillarca granosa]|uniref:Uncharacterized protein n=1 Tax=Tegillarca granosa TaxID=220873 RepID=A0ABQ9E4M1_TEGGR|nr:hypothetical protein KUTeg_021883 [Tegillarca granosa]
MNVKSEKGKFIGRVTCIICKKQKKPRNQILCRTNDAKCKAVQLICPDHSVIYNPDVFVDTADCAKGFYWTDICDLNDSIIIGGGSIDRGIIRSHSIMPWSYDKSVLNNQSLCRRELHPTSKQSVIITVDGINDTGIINDVIDVDNDVGYITDKDTYYNISDIVWKTKHFPVGKPVYINFGSGETKGASGFIICFKFTNEAVKSTKKPVENPCCSTFAVANPYEISSSLPCLRQPLEDRRCSTFAVTNPYKISSSLPCLRQPLEDWRCSPFAVTNPYKISSSLPCLRIPPLEDRRCSTFAVTNPYKISSFLQCLRQPLEDQLFSTVVERRHVAEKEKTRNRRQRKLKEKTNENSAKGRIGGRKPKEKI